MGFVRNDHNVPSVGQFREAEFFTFGKKLLHRGKHNAARSNSQEFAQMSPVSRLFRRLSQELAAPSERTEQLIVQIVAVGNDDQCRVSHLRAPDDAPGVKCHSQAFARPLRVPDYAAAFVPVWARRLHGGINCRSNGVKLVITGNLLGNRIATRFLKHNEVTKIIQKPFLVKESLDCHLKF